MNIPLIMALMAGQHRHQYADSSGKCSICGKEHLPHKWNQGTCTVCGFSGCEHSGGWSDYTDEHVCNTCGIRLPHRFQANPSGTVCQVCLDCGHTIGHSCLDSTPYSCGTCSGCGLTFGAHLWDEEVWGEDGKCTMCGYECTHPSVSEDHVCAVCGSNVGHSFPNPTADGCGVCEWCGQEFNYHIGWNGKGKCPYCGYECTHPSFSPVECKICGYIPPGYGEYYVTLNGPYEGGYRRAGSFNDYTCYRQHIYDPDTDQWVAHSYYLVKFYVPHPTRYGGDYAYTGSGIAFVTDPENIPFNSTLLSGNGKFKIHLKQYTLDGDFIAEGRYTSDDCKNLEANSNLPYKENPIV